MCKDMDCDIVNISSLKILSALLTKHYNRKVILLIDEYDMPLVQAFEQDYYESMIILMKSLFEQALKTNDNLKLARETRFGFFDFPKRGLNFSIVLFLKVRRSEFLRFFYASFLLGQFLVSVFGFIDQNRTFIRITISNTAAKATQNPMFRPSHSVVPKSVIQSSFQFIVAPP